MENLLLIIPIIVSTICQIISLAKGDTASAAKAEQKRQKALAKIAKKADKLSEKAKELEKQ